MSSTISTGLIARAMAEAGEAEERRLVRLQQEAELLREERRMALDGAIVRILGVAPEQLLGFSNNQEPSMRVDGRLWVGGEWGGGTMAGALRHLRVTFFCQAGEEPGHLGEPSTAVTNLAELGRLCLYWENQDWLCRPCRARAGWS